MSARDDGSREIAIGLVASLRPALPAEASAVTRMAARDVAQVIGLTGLDAALAVLDAHAGPRRPRDVGLLAARIERLAHDVERESHVRALREADAELADHAARLSQREWADAPESASAPAEHVHAAAEVLADLPVGDVDGFDRARLTAPVASALRAAVDWAGFDLARKLQVQMHDSALTLTGPCGHEAGLGPAGAVLATVEGSLAKEPDGRWTMRVPMHGERGSFLLLRQGRLAIALPWHTVSRLRMLAPGAERSLSEPVLAPFTTSAPSEGERPAALVARGLSRAWLIADRIVWRIAADPIELDEVGPFGVPSHVVLLENDDRYWVADAAHLLREIEAPGVSLPAPRPRFAAPMPAIEEPVATEAPAAPAETETLAAEIVETPSADDLLFEVTTPAPQAPLEEPAPADVVNEEEEEQRAQESLADAVARAIDLLRGERPAVTPAAPAAPVAPVVPVEPETFEAIDAPEAPPEPAPSFAPLYRAHVTVVAPSDVLPAIEAPAPSPVLAPTYEAEPLSELEPAPEEPLTPLESLVETPVHERPSVEAARHPVPRALVADDSLVARIFLGRMLERRGFVVETVGDGAAMWEELRRGPWSIVCADFAMPDSWGRAHLERLLDHRANCREPYQLVVLTRDADEEVVARDAGATLMLRKPFENEALDRLLPTHA